VLAAGGGAVLREENRQNLTTGGKLIWLQASPATIARRIASDNRTAARRPQLTPLGCEAEIVDVLAERTPIYQGCADIAVDTEGKTPEEVALEIMTSLDLPTTVELA
jgi:shikimate kinase